MPVLLERRYWITATFLPTVLAQSPSSSTPPPQLDLQLVKDWVGKAHQRKIEPMRELLKQSPALIQASYDQGAGDWESALQAAAHTGSHEMARFLLDSGARLDLFAAAMLGELRFVKLSLEVFPQVSAVRGAHGIPLLSHAIAGGEQAAAVFEFLLERGADVNAVHNNGMTPLFIAVQVGRREAVKRLLEKGADSRRRALNGATPLALALKRGDSQIAADLRGAGATE
jgi:ankyrin repeat protein